MMKPTVSVITLGVSDLRKSEDFYTNVLKFKKRGSDSEKIVFYELDNIVLAIFPREDLADDAQVSAEGSGFHGITLAHNVASENEVNEIIKDLHPRGVKIVKKPQKTGWGGYDAYFSDPDGYLWEVVYNPFWKIDE